MAQDFRASQVRTGKIIASGSSAGGARIAFYDIAADSQTTPNQGDINQAVFVTSSIGSDVFLFVSGTNNSVNLDAPNRRLALFSDVAISGSILFPTSSDPSKEAFYGLLWRGETTDAYIAHVDGGDPGLFNLEFSNDRGGMYFTINGDNPDTTKYEFTGGRAIFYEGITGSLTLNWDGNAAIVGTGSIHVSTSSTGQIIISSSAESGGGGGGGGSVQWNEGSPSPRLNTTASVAIAGGLGTSYDAQDAGTNVVFFVSGSNAAVPAEFITGSDRALLPNTVVSGNIELSYPTTLTAGVSQTPSLIWRSSNGNPTLRIWSNNTFLPSTGVMVFVNDIGGNDPGLAVFDGKTTNIFNANRWQHFDPTANQLTPTKEDVYFEVSGAIGSKGTSTVGVALFRGDLHVSGNLTLDSTTGTLSQDRAYTTTTTDATPTQLITYQLGASALYDISLTINAASTGSGLTKRFKRNVAVSYYNLTASILENSVFVPIPDVSGSTGANTWDVGIRTSGSAMYVDVTGSSSTAIRWGAKLEALSVVG